MAKNCRSTTDDGICVGEMLGSTLKLLTAQASHPTPLRAKLIAQQLSWLEYQADICPQFRMAAGEMSDYWESVALATNPLASRK